MSLHLEHLNPEQLAAVTLPDEHALILAGAGSGKTRVLTTRIAWLVKEGRVSPGGVLAVTFTNKAAREMFTRVSAMLPVNPRGMWIGTFHGLCNRMLRAHYRDAGLPQQFQILDTQDQLAAVKRLLKSLNVDEDRFAPREVQYFINARKEEGLRAGDVEVYDETSRRLAELYAAYDAQCQREGVVDFPELLLRSFELLLRNELLRAHYAGRFRHILVDEFQDTNRLQYRWLKLLAGAAEGPGARPAPGGAAVFAVGDDDQSIYAFRGANVGNMADFERDFAVTHVVRLEQNYRSQGNILDAANALIANNRKRLGKNLWTAAGAGEPLRIYEGESDADEARWIVEQAQSLAREGTRLDHMAVLYRSNAQSRVIEHALFSAGVAYRVYGGLRFFERAEVKHALAYLRLVASPDDDNALLRVVNFPPRGIGARSVEQLQDAARAQGSSLWQATGTLGGRAAQSLAAFRALVEEMRAAAGDLPLAELVEHVVSRSGLLQHYRNEREGADRIENLGELVTAAAGFDAEEHASGLETGEGEADAPAIDPLTAFLTHAALEAGEHQAAEGQDALQLMTVHSAKGLEFDCVFLTGLEEGLFPHEQSAVEKDGLEEERRLAYVAITRAPAAASVVRADPHAARPDALQPAVALRRGDSRGRDQVAVATLCGQRAREAMRAAASGWDRPRKAAFGGAAPAAGRARHAGFGMADDGLGFRIGQNVVHPKFGAGVIVDAEGRGNDARVQVNFGREGVKWLAVNVAKLQAALSLAQEAGRASVGALFRHRVRSCRAQTALIEGERRLTYAALDSRSDRLAHALAARGVRRGERVALLARNCIEYVEVGLACAKLGAIAAALNWRLAGRELAHCINLVEPRVLVHQTEFSAALDAIALCPHERIALGAEYEAELEGAAAGTFETTVDPEDGLVILYTSGTTGLPKGAVISHRAMIARGLCFAAELSIPPGDSFVAWPPMYHMASTDQMLSTLLRGGTVIVVDGFQPAPLLEAIAQWRMGWFILIPGMVEAMIAALRARPVKPAGIGCCGAMADLVPRQAIAEASALLEAPFLNSFGSTETGLPPATGALIPPGEVPQRLSKRQSAFCEIRLVDAEDNEVPDGTPGELAIRAPTLFSGYWNAPETNARDFRNGWFHMGDVFRRNADGTLDFVDRVKYMIKSGGENIYPAEIEQVILADARVADAVVVRKSDARWGEVPVAFVARRDPSLDEAAVLARCREMLSGYKQPKAVHFIALEEFPRSTSGKIQRHALEARLAADR